MIEGPRSSKHFEDEVKFDLVRSFRWGCSKKDHDTKCAVNRINEIQQWLKKNDVNRILVTGKMGSGKTAFIRGITDSFLPSADTLLPHTTVVTPHESFHEGSNCIFYDTPGLKDDAESSNDYEYLTEMVRKNGEPHLVIFAVKMDDYVFQEDDVEAIANISAAFGWRIWKKAMFILTFANMVHKVGQAPGSVDNKLHFSNSYDRHHMDIVEALKHNNVEKEVINNIAVVPVGLISVPKIPADRRGVSWIDNFWKEAFKILKKPKKTYDTPADNTEPNRQSEDHSKSKTGKQDTSNKGKQDKKTSKKGKQDKKPSKKGSSLSLQAPSILYLFVMVLCHFFCLLKMSFT